MKGLRVALLGLSAVIAIVLGTGFLRRAIAPPPQGADASDAAQDRSAAGSPADPAAAGPTASDRAAPGAEAAGPSSARQGAPAPVGDAADATRGSIEQAIAATPDYRAFFDKLRAAFPADYAAILGNEASALRPGSVDVDAVTADAVTALRRAHGTLATKAPDGTLAQIFAQQLREMEALGRRDPHLCVAFLYGSSGSGFLSFAAANRALIADAAAAGLDAMIAGGTAPVTRTAPTDADFQALEAALMAKGLGRPAIEALLDGKSADPPIPDAQMCEAGQTYLRTLAAMPAEARGRLYGLAVELMARS